MNRTGACLTLCLLLASTLAIPLHPQTQATTPPDACLRFAAFTDTHIGIGYEHPGYHLAHRLTQLATDLTTATPPCDFSLHLGDLINHNTAQIHGTGLPSLVNQYANNLKASLIQPLNLPFFYVLGNHDLDDYQRNPTNPHNLTQTLLDETSLIQPTYAIMRDNILFLIIPELTSITWTHPTLYEWLDTMTSHYHNTTTILCCHQAIEDTTREDSHTPYRGKQDTTYWTSLFQRNPQIIMWIHGHNHEPDWLIANHSTGLTAPVQQFGHPIAFTSPYPQMNWKPFRDEDRIVIYTINATTITTRAWRETDTGGRWATGYDHSWTINTSFDPDTPDWYATPVFLQDNETQCTDLKLISPKITLQLTGTSPMDLFVDPHIESPNGSRYECILGFGNDSSGNVEWTDPGMRVHGPTMLTFPVKYPDNASVQEDGRSGPLYHSFPMGTIGAAVPGQTCDFTITARCPSGSGNLRLNVSCSDWGTRTQYSTLSGSCREVLTHRFGPTNETITGQYMVPADQNAWFLQGELQFLNTTDYEVSLFSIQRTHDSNMTEDFHLSLGGRWYNSSGPLACGEQVNFSIDPEELADAQGVMTFTSRINGNRNGMAVLVFEEPILMGLNARFRVTTTDGGYELTLTKTLTRTSPLLMRIWESPVFQKMPRATELLVRVMLAAGMDTLLKTLFIRNDSDLCSTFELLPFSTDPLYSGVNVTAMDGSGIRHQSLNGNLWWSCNGPDLGETIVRVRFPRQ